MLDAIGRHHTGLGDLLNAFGDQMDIVAAQGPDPNAIVTNRAFAAQWIVGDQLFQQPGRTLGLNTHGLDHHGRDVGIDLADRR